MAATDASESVDTVLSDKLECIDVSEPVEETEDAEMARW